MMRCWAYNRFGVLMGASPLASDPRWPSLRGNSWPMITLFPSQGYFCVTANTVLQDDLANVNVLTNQLAQLNVTVQQVEGYPKNNVNTLRDQRDLLLKQLSEKVNITSFETY